MNLNFSIGSLEKTGRTNENHEELFTRTVALHEQEYGQLSSFSITFTKATEQIELNKSESRAVSAIRRLHEYVRVAELMRLRNALAYNLLEKDEVNPRIRMREIQIELSNLHHAYVTLCRSMNAVKLGLSEVSVEWVLKNMSLTEYANKTAHPLPARTQFITLA